MKNFVNIDSLINIGKRKISVIKLFPETKKEYKKYKSSKMYKWYEAKEGDNLNKIVESVIKEFPETLNHYTKEELIEEIKRTNSITGQLEVGAYIIAPCYIRTYSFEEKQVMETKKEEAASLDDFEKYTVKENETYFNIARMYTADDKEIVRLVGKIQELNDYITLNPGLVITIPNVKKYLMLHEEELKKVI